MKTIIGVILALTVSNTGATPHWEETGEQVLKEYVERFGAEVVVCSDGSCYNETTHQYAGLAINNETRVFLNLPPNKENEDLMEGFRNRMLYVKKEQTKK